MGRRITNNSKKAASDRKRVERFRLKKKNRKIYEAKVQKFREESVNNEKKLSEKNQNESENVEPEYGIQHKLRIWAVKHRITKTAINDLLGLLIWFGLTSLPRDSRTLLKTPTHIPMQTLSNGRLWINGLQKTLSKALEKCKKDITVTLDFNFDGMPLFDSSTLQFWPIIYSIRGNYSISITSEK